MMNLMLVGFDNELEKLAFGGLLAQVPRIAKGIGSAVLKTGKMAYRHPGASLNTAFGGMAAKAGYDKSMESFGKAVGQ